MEYNYRSAAEHRAAGTGYLLDLTPLGRQESWEEPEGRAVDPRGASPDFAT
jgi:hypothetical protein